jgi:hypothetical protein
MWKPTVEDWGRKNEFDYVNFILNELNTTRLYPKVSRLAAWSENYKWYSFLPLGAVISLFYESV